MRSYFWFYTSVILACVFGLGGWLLGTSQLNRTESSWQSFLTQVAQTHTERVNGWMQQQSDTLQNLADNPTLQLYFLEATQGTTSAQKEYLSNMLTLTSSNLGLQSKVNPAAAQEAVAKAEGGVAMLTRDLELVTASKGMPALSESLQKEISGVAEGKTAWLNISTAETGTPVTGVVMPIYNVQADPAGENQAGYIVSMVPLDTEFFARMTENTSVPEGVKTTLSYEGQGATSSTDNALVTANAIPSTPWKITTSVPRDIALSDVSLSRILMAVVGACLGVILASLGQIITSIRAEASTVAATQKITSLLSSLVDDRDPNASKHSARVAELATAIGASMALKPQMLEATKTAASLMNVGKAYIPGELLTRPSTLTTQEIDAIRNSLHESAELLKGVRFTGPVVETLQQVQEHMDGSGPLGLKGARIMVSSRIVAVANSYVAMTSPRAYRAPMSSEQALQVLEKESGHRFDPVAVNALRAHVLRNPESGLKRAV